MKKLILACVFILGVFISFSQQSVIFFASDSVLISGDLYMTKDKEAPFILLFHQAFFSRGEYIDIAPKLNAMGYNCLAIDQRFGKEVNKIKNKTSKNAKKKGVKKMPKDTYPDLEAALGYVKRNYKPKQLIVWGSSYSASLSLVLASKHKEIDALLLFSPGEYFKYENKHFCEWAKTVDCPVFMTSSQKEAKKRTIIFNTILIVICV